MKDRNTQSQGSVPRVLLLIILVKYMLPARLLACKDFAAEGSKIN